MTKFRKMIVYSLLIAIIFPVLLLAAPGGVKAARQLERSEDPTPEYAADTRNEVFKDVSDGDGDGDGDGGGPKTKTVETPCTGGTWGIPKDIPACAHYGIVFLLYQLMRITIWGAGLVSDLFNISIQFSLTGEIFDAKKNIMIGEGWEWIRDMLNLAFIFAILYAAISTILQYGNFQIKSILPSLVIAALLMNFSMMITKMVIDSSHIFAWEFYNQIDVVNKAKDGDGKQFPNLKSSVSIKTEDTNFQMKNLASAFFAGFNPQRILVGGGIKTQNEDGSLSPWDQIMASMNEAKGKDGDYSSILWKMFLILSLEIVLVSLASFVLLAGAIIFFIRIIVLWLVMIFSPLAFLGFVLPNFKSYSSQWWDKLIGQSFMAPAFLFMFMLSVKLINTGFIEKFFKITENDDSMAALGFSMGPLVTIFFNFAIVGGLMYASLMASKKLGGETASLGISAAHKIKGWAGGAANKIAWKPTRLGLRSLGGAAGDSNWFNKSFGRIPFVGSRVARKLGAMRKEDQDKAKKKGEKYAGTLSEAGLKSLDSEIKKSSITGFLGIHGGSFGKKREGYEKVIKKKGAERAEKNDMAKKVLGLTGQDENDEDLLKKTGTSLFLGETEGDKGIDVRIEEKRNKLREDNAAKKKEISKKKIELSTKMEMERIRLAEAIRRHDNVYVEEVRKSLSKLATDMEEQNNGLEGILGKEAEFERIQKIIDRYVDKRRTALGKPVDKGEDKKGEDKKK